MPPGEPTWTVDLPATAGVTYLNTGSAGPLLASASAAMTGQLERELTEGRAGQAAWEEFLASRQRLRAGLGVLCGAGADEITLRDVTDLPHAEPGRYPGSKDVTLHVLTGSGHCQYTASARQFLWHRINQWITTVIASREDTHAQP